MIKITEEDAKNYAYWLLNECSCPFDEIKWLITTIIESDNDHVIEEVFNEMKQNDLI